MSVMLSTDYVWMSAVSVCLNVCNKMYCDETTNATNIRFGTNMHLDNRNRSAELRRKKSAILAAGGHLRFLKTNNWKCCNFLTVWAIDSRPTAFCSGLNSLELWLHTGLSILHIPINKMVGGWNTINAITSAQFDRFAPNRRHFVQSAIVYLSLRFSSTFLKINMGLFSHWSTGE
jgi:hypothetical protein